MASGDVANVHERLAARPRAKVTVERPTAATARRTGNPECVGGVAIARHETAASGAVVVGIGIDAEAGR